jgi:hypothetical protein
VCNNAWHSKLESLVFSIVREYSKESRLLKREVRSRWQ